MNPVFVWITCRNYEQYLLDAVRSVTAQKFPTGQHRRVFLNVSHDDCNGDSPIGVAANRNKALKHEWLDCCQYIIFLDADDTLPTNYVDEMLYVADGDDCIVACGAKLFGDECRRAEVRTPITMKSLLNANSIHCSALIPVKHFKAVGGYREDLASHEDWELWVRLASKGIEFRNTQATYLNYRRHSGSRSKFNPEGFWKIRTQLNQEYGKVTK